MRAAARGTYYVDEIICGLPCSAWISLTEETFSLTAHGATFHAWPDGGSLMEQEQCVVDVLKRILAEMIRDIRDGQKQN